MSEAPLLVRGQGDLTHGNDEPERTPSDMFFTGVGLSSGSGRSGPTLIPLGECAALVQKQAHLRVVVEGVRGRGRHPTYNVALYFCELQNTRLL